MKDNTAAQNKLGELYVDLGMRGLTSMIKGLGGISLGFLGVQKAASTYINTIRTAGETAVSVRKMQNTLGVSAKESQAIINWAERKGINSGAFIGDIEKSLGTLWRRQSGLGISGSVASGLTMLNQLSGSNIDLSKYSGTTEGTIKYLSDVGEALSKISDVGAKRQIVDLLELSNEALDYMSLGVDKYKDIMNVLNETDIKNAEKAREEMVKVSQAWTRLIEAFALGSADKLIKALDLMTAILTPKKNRSAPQQKKVNVSRSAAIAAPMFNAFQMLDPFGLHNLIPGATPNVLKNTSNASKLPTQQIIENKTINQTNHVHVDSVKKAAQYQLEVISDSEMERDEANRRMGRSR